MKTHHISHARRLILTLLFFITVLVLTYWLSGNISTFSDFARIIGIFAVFLVLPSGMIAVIYYSVTSILALAKKRGGNQTSKNKRRFWGIFWAISIPVSILFISAIFFLGGKGTSFKQYGISLLTALIGIIGAIAVVGVPFLVIILLSKIKNIKK